MLANSTLADRKAIIDVIVQYATGVAGGRP